MDWMDADIAFIFLNKLVRVETNTKWFYHGMLKEVTSDGILIDDRKLGTTYISFGDISQISEWFKKKEDGL